MIVTVPCAPSVTAVTVSVSPVSGALSLADPQAAASIAIRDAARGIIAATPQELPVMQAESPAAPALAPIGGTELPVVQVSG